MSTINYTVTVASAKFLIDGAEAPKLTFRDGDTYVLDQADSSNAGHTLQFSITSNNSGSSEYTTGVTKTGTAGQAGAKTTIVTSGSTVDTLYFYSSGGGTYGEEFSNSGFNTSTTYNFLKPIVGAETTAEKWGPMINHALDQIDQGIDAAITAQNLDFQGDSGGALEIDLDSETLDIAGGTGIDTTGSGNEVSVAIDSTVATLTGSQTLTNKTLTAPLLGTPTSGVMTNVTGTAAGLTAGNATLAATVTTNATLTGDVTSSGNATSIAAGVIINADVKSDAAIAMSKTALVGGAGLTLTTNTLSVDADQSGQITSIGTIGTGTWQGTAVADAYIASAATWNAKEAAGTGVAMAIALG